MSSRDGAVRRHPLLTNWRQPLITLVSMALCVGLVAAVLPQPGALVFVAALAMTMSRNRLVLSWRGRAEAVILLPLIALATAGVGMLLEFVPVVGAIAYVAAMFLAIWLRRYGSTATRIGSLIALPFITLLVVPGGGAGTTIWGAAILSVVALIVVVAVRLLTEVTGLVARDESASLRASAGRAAIGGSASAPPSSLRPIASTRMAIQIAVALAVAFPLGWLVFPGHVTWVVLTAYLVCSGNRGRADVLYKSGLRIVGAVAGTVAAALIFAVVPAGHPALAGPLLVAVLLLILGIGLWLREWTYAAWALAMTLVITLLQGAVVPAAHEFGVSQLWERVLAIVVGAACGLAASWFIMPIRSEGVVRRRLAAALAALNDFLIEPGLETDTRVSEALLRLDEVARPWNAWERVSQWRQTSRKPGQWMRLVHEIVRLARAHPEATGPVRRALGNARKSVREPVAIGPALVDLRDSLNRA